MSTTSKRSAACVEKDTMGRAAKVRDPYLSGGRCMVQQVHLALNSKNRNVIRSRGRAKVI